MLCTNHSEFVRDTQEEGKGPSVCCACKKPLCWICTKQILILQCPKEHDHPENYYDYEELDAIIESCTICTRRMGMQTDSFRYCEDCLASEFLDHQNNVAYDSLESDLRAMEFILDTFSWSVVYKALRNLGPTKTERRKLVLPQEDEFPFMIRINHMSHQELLDILTPLMCHLGLNLFKVGKRLNIPPFQPRLEFKDQLNFACEKCHEEVEVYLGELPDTSVTHCAQCIAQLSKDRPDEETVVHPKPANDSSDEPPSKKRTINN